MNRRSHQRIHPHFLDIADNIKKELEINRKRKVSFPELTLDLANFIENEGIDKIIKRRAKRNRGNLR